MRLLKQSTSVDVPIGPFLDSTDGVTAETALTLTQPDIRLKKNGGNWAQKNAAQTLSHEENGYYEVTLDATDTNTLGLLRLAVAESGACPIFEDFMVVTANFYDTLFSTDLFDVSVTQWNGTAVASPHTAGYPVVTVKDGTGTGEIDTASGVVLAKDHTGANLATASALDAVDNFLDTEIAAILAKTDLIPGTQDGKTFAETILLMAAALLGKASGLGTTTATFRSLDDAHDRIVATVDADGNRSAVTLDASSP